MEGSTSMSYAKGTYLQSKCPDLRSKIQAIKKYAVAWYGCINVLCPAILFILRCAHGKQNIPIFPLLIGYIYLRPIWGRLCFCFLLVGTSPNQDTPVRRWGLLPAHPPIHFLCTVGTHRDKYLPIRVPHWYTGYNVEGVTWQRIRVYKDVVLVIYMALVILRDSTGQGKWFGFNICPLCPTAVPRLRCTYYSQ